MGNIDEQQIKDYSSRELIRDVYSLVKPFRVRFWSATILRITADVIWLYQPIIFASLVTFLTKYKPGESLHEVWVLLMFWAIILTVRSLCIMYAKTLGYYVAEDAAVALSRRSLKHLFRLDMVWHERENSGNKIKRISNGSAGVNRIVRIWFINVIEITVNLIGISIVLAHFDPTILVPIIIFLASYFLISRYITKGVSEASYNVNIQEEQVNGLLFESVSNMRTIKVMGMGSTLYKLFLKSTEDLITKLRIRIHGYQFRGSFLSFWARGFNVILVAFIVWGISEGRYEVGFLVLFQAYFSQLYAAIAELSTVTVDLATARISIARNQMMLREKVLIDDETGKESLGSDWKTIHIKDISFSYGGNKVLNNISFEVKRGEKIGIVGLSGAGKSTLLKLLLKEREEFTGDILFDTISIKDIRKDDYFKSVSVVLQDTEVFNFSLKENITIGSGEGVIDEAVLDQALATSHITELVEKLPEGLETLIGEKGIKLSGGERQRLGIARAVFRQPEILLLDEATSHLDLESEEKIRDSLHRFFENVTAIVIAHRLTTIKEMDKILVLEDGSIIESGSFKELYKKKGRFYDLWEKQNL